MLVEGYPPILEIYCRHEAFMSHLSELQITYAIQQFRTAEFDAFFKFLNFFDRPEFFFVLVPAIWVGKGWKTGIKLFYLLVLSSFVNYGLKHLFGLPRPVDLDPTVEVIHVGGYGLPSGAAQTVALLGPLLLIYGKSPWKWPVAISYMALVSLSRLYLGVHFFTDILGGWAVGLALLGLFLYAKPRLEKKLAKLKPSSLFALSQCVPLSWILIHPIHPVPQMAACAMGLGIGLWIEYCKKPSLLFEPIRGKFAYRAAIGIGGAIACYFLASWLMLGPFLQSLIYGLWIASGSFFVCRKLF